MMSLPDFIKLPIDLQVSYLWDNGQYLTSHTDQRYRINLYSVHHYFVEVWYDTKLGLVHAITAFHTSRRLESYVKTISITGILQ